MNRHLRLVLLATLLAALACSFPSSPGAPSESASLGEPTLTPKAPGLGETEPPATEAPLPPVVEPVFRIVYTDAGNVWVLEQDGSSHQLTTDGMASDVLISSDGARIAYLLRAAPDFHGELRAINADGSAAGVLLTAAQLDAFYPIGEGSVGTDISQIAFIPGTHQLIFNTYLIPEAVGFTKHDDLWIIDADTAVLTSLLPAGEGGDFLVSPDGMTTAVITPTSLGMIDLDGTNHRQDLITYPWVITYSEFLFYPRGVWTADSTALGATIPSEDPLIDSVSGTLWRVPAGSGPASGLATIPGNFYFHFWQHSALSPDLGRVAFSRRAGVDDEDLILAQTDGTGQVIYATGEWDWEGWSPDSTHFAYSFGSPSSLMIGAAGGPPMPLAPGTDFLWIDNMEYLFLAGSAGSWILVRGTIGGAPPQALVSPAGDFVSYDFTR